MIENEESLPSSGSFLYTFTFVTFGLRWTKSLKNAIIFLNIF